MIVYFTGTGNSRFVAQKIADITGDSLYDSGRAIRGKEDGLFEEENKIVFVCPVYMSAPAMPFVDFLKKSKFKAGTKAYFFMTYGAGIGASDRFCMKLCEEKGLTYMGVTGVVMPNNYLLYFKVKNADENKKTVREAIPRIFEAAELIKNDEKFAEVKSSTSSYLIAKASIPLYGKFMITAKGYHATDKCIGCSKCVSVCPLGNITMDGPNPSWGSECTHCTACINLCPQEAIEFRNKTLGKPRYHGPSKMI